MSNFALKNHAALALHCRPASCVGRCGSVLNESSNGIGAHYLICHRAKNRRSSFASGPIMRSSVACSSSGKWNRVSIWTTSGFSMLRYLVLIVFRR